MNLAMNIDEQTVYGSKYADWKTWDAEDFGDVDVETAEYYKAELVRAGVVGSPGLRVLELGFGNGGLMKYLRSEGWNVIGTEVNDRLLDRAKARGFDVRHAEAMGSFPDASFDLVLAFDVLEHVPQEALPSLLNEVRRLLADGGTFLARFPNGDSPLGLANQHGDVTHLTTIGSAKARFLCDTAGLRTRLLDAPARSVLSRNLKRMSYNLLLLPPRWIVEKAVKLLFFPGSDIKFFSSNLVIVADKSVRAG